MGKSVFYGVCLLGLFFLSTATRSDAGGPDGAATNVPSLPSSAADEPITGTPAVSARGSETPRHGPFTPYDIGPPGTKAWSYQDLGPDEKAYADHVRQTPMAASSADGFAAAAKERAQHAAGAAAAHQLGVDSLATTGVVPCPARHQRDCLKTT